MTVAQDEGECRKTEAKRSLEKWIAAEKASVRLRHANVYVRCDEKGQREDNPKKACSCWFARESWLATSGANLYHFLFCFDLISSFLLSLNPWSFVQSSFDVHDAPTAARS